MSFNNDHSFILDKPSDIYNRLSSELNKLLTKMQNAHENISVQKAQSSGKNIISRFYYEVSEEVKQLEKNAEWDRFNIAFFGETNAGKSTIIECLRIFLKESSKISQQSNFKSKQMELNASEESINELDVEISLLDQQLEILSDAIKKIQVSHIENNFVFQEKINELETLALNKKAAFMWWKKILFIFLKLPEEKEVFRLRDCLKSEILEQQHALDKIKKSEQEFLIKKAQVSDEKTTILKYCEELKIYADGEIIGDGRSDYTRVVQQFSFSINNQEVVILDVPGIEGKESIVEAEIAKSVKKAHAVFYVTSKDAPPNEGTLEKIKSYLSDQTEVWSIYNKQITNPRALRKELVSADDQRALVGLDEVMSNTLGQKTYKHHITLAGLPAFFGLATCIVPFSEQRKEQRKFLDSKGVDGLLGLSNFFEFHQLLVCDIVGDVDFKIKKANFNKVKFLLNRGVHKLRTVNEDHYKPIKKDLEDILHNTSREIDSNFDNLNSAFRRNGETVVDNFKNITRETIYAKIDSKIDNNKFKLIFEETLYEQLEILQKNIEQINKKSVLEFENMTKEAIDRLQERMAIKVNSYQHSSPLKDMQLELSLSMESGINKWGLVGTAVGLAATMWWNPVGWVAGVLAGVGLVISFAKAIWSIFDSDYKKSQQRKNVDANLSRVSNKVRDSIHESINKLMPSIKQELDQLKTSLSGTADYVSTISNDLERTAQQFNQLSAVISQQYGE